ncbi:MAG: DUF2339 domain-containing protein [Planctomycetota bacterium]|jgi:uncharacterized membrane protein
MEGIFILLGLAFICCVLCGPIALIISINSLNKLKEIKHQLRMKAVARPGAARREEKIEEIPRPAEVIEKEPVEEKRPIEEAAEKAEAVGAEAFSASIMELKETEIARPKTGALEQRIGTRWLLFAGIISIIVAVGFFLKFAYDNMYIGPLGRVVIAAVSGLIALSVGEVTRRRGYGIVAKAVTALGFSILYAAVFSAYRYYGLINSTPAFVLAILITAAAMLYAVSLNEIVVALLSLLGGFLTPVIVSTGENLPIPLFSYVLVLSVGAMLCAYYRKWQAVNLLAFLGTFALYTGWFEKFFRPAMRASEGIPEQMAVALVWLGIFFAVYLVLPILYELVKKVKAQEEDVVLILLNAAVVFYYLWSILFAKYRTELAFCAIGLCAAHLVMMSVVIRRCPKDVNLRLGLLVIGLFFLTIAVPLYLKMYAVAMAWAIEGLILMVIGLRYRSIWTQVGGAAAVLLSIGQLLHRLPMHTGAFQLVFNPAFGTWVLVAGVVFVCHIVYRRNSETQESYRSMIFRILYAAAVFILMAAVMMEWWWHCDYNIGDYFRETSFFKGMAIIFSVFTVALILRPVTAGGQLCTISATALAFVGSLFTMITFTEFHRSSFLIFVNVDLMIALVFVGALFLTAWLLKHTVEEEKYNAVYSMLLALAGIFVLWVVLSEEIYMYWYCQNRYAEKIANWRFLANMFISVMWSVYGSVLIVIGFWRKIELLRYIAFGLFALLLAKVFILDTSAMKNVYRIAAFLATGVTLVGISYLYQFSKKKGFFDSMLSEKSVDND